MNAEKTRITPEEARERLAASRDDVLPSGRDRQIHATGTAIFGLTSGLYMASQNVIEGVAAVVLSCIALAVFLAEGFWVERAARTVPRRARLWSRLGIGASMVLGLAVVLPWLNSQAQVEPNTWTMAAAGALVVAVPSLVAGAVIVRGSR